MCFKKPKKPRPTPEQLRADANLERQMEMQAQLLREQRSENKRARFEDRLNMMEGFGRRSLLTGGRGGIGYAAPTMRSLFMGLRGD